MRPDLPTQQTQAGNMLVMAVFVILVMTMLSLAIVNILSSASQSVIYEVLGLRAQHVARSSLETHLAQVFRADGTLDIAACDAPLNLDFSASTIVSVQGCVAQSSCRSQVYTSGDGVVTHLMFNSDGQCTSGNTVASRSIAVDAVER
ncbi:hypothetical protein [Bowmanella sp. JS7-9]|uniref:MSHA biogenesis protein MshP n=1 Tax=Pseudobowmanella zhangzhouensis TaxID=1537679 RepID=A0ABW1XPB7_9ALTE|nr:hypothetical protein [Bowmanella sp. JS7-9]